MGIKNSAVCRICGCGVAEISRIEHLNCDYLRCASCGHEWLFADHEKDMFNYFELAQTAIYENELHGHLSPFAHYVAANLAKHRIRFLKQFLESGKVLEVGPGTGEVMFAAKKAGYEVEGVEYSRNLVKYLRLMNISTVYQGDLEQIHFGDNRFDAVLSFHVLEHVPNPERQLQRIRSVLKPAGYLILATPNSSSWDRRLMKERWTGYSVGHINLFSRRSMELMLKKTQWKIVRIYTTESPLAFLWSIKSGLKPKKRDLGLNCQETGLKKIPLPIGRALLTMVAGLTMPFRYAQSKLHLGNELLVVAQPGDF